MTARNSSSVTSRKSRGANRSVGFRMSALPQRMNCLPRSTVERALSQRRPRVAQRQRRPPQAPVPHIDTPFALDLLDRVDARVERSRERQPVGGLCTRARSETAPRPRPARRPAAWSADRPSTESEPKPRYVNSCALAGTANASRSSSDSHSGFRSACSVKSSSLSGMLYSSFSSVRIVRLLRRRSIISSRRAVQMPCTCTKSLYFSRRTTSVLM